jgi:hypothetical protein
MKKVFASSTLKSLVAACAVSATALGPLAGTPAAAGQRSFYEGDPCYYRDGIRECDGSVRRFNGSRRHHGVKKHHRRHDRVENDAAAAAIIGLAGAAILFGALSNANPPVREYRVAPSPYPPAPGRGPDVITYESRLQPWSPEWYRWCDARYRSFNPQTGTFRGYDGLDHFCVPR